MIYLDTSVALAHLLVEDRRPSPSLWKEELVSSRLLEYELGVRINARGLSESHGPLVEALLDRVSILEMIPQTLSRILEPFPVVVRTLDAIHLASAVFLCERGLRIEIATYDHRMLSAAEAMGFAIWKETGSVGE